MLLARGKLPFKTHLAFPLAGEIVGVSKRLAVTKLRALQRNLACVLEPQPFGRERLYRRPCDLKLVEMHVRPAEGDLDHRCSFPERLSAGDQKPLPDRRTDPKKNLELVDRPQRGVEFVRHRRERKATAREPEKQSTPRTGAKGSGRPNQPLPLRGTSLLTTKIELLTRLFAEGVRAI
jgi:hypothetical protein